MHTPDILGWVKRSDIEICADKYILIELSELVVFDYGLSETQDGLRCLRNGSHLYFMVNILSLRQELR